MLNIGVLALQGGVAEHVSALRQASAKAKIPISLRTVRTARDLEGLHALLLPGGESTALSLLLEREGMFELMKRIPALFGTCAGLILMADEVDGAEPGQQSLGVMPITVTRNAYGTQSDSFESRLDGELTGKAKILFIRAPKISAMGEGVQVLSRLPKTNEAVIVEYRTSGRLLFGATCHPELTTSKVHEYFLKELAGTLGPKE
ncbi:MAG: pyridoxal 5'-phosphate synthase glutaminase subunit PdxT [Candidatus Micrarchaeota archaeon]|nr:pyridoxal 5'-phosphate synthase glutaminase subunit PdxT [Candidatus Micrarchaeota archaeon]